jgi:hypothetical protein
MGPTTRTAGSATATAQLTVVLAHLLVDHQPNPRMPSPHQVSRAGTDLENDS